MFLVVQDKATSGKELHGARLLSVILAESDVSALFTAGTKSHRQCSELFKGRVSKEECAVGQQCMSAELLFVFGDQRVTALN